MSQSGIAAIQAAILRIVVQIPAGCVATYGGIARLAGYPRHARFVGGVLSRAGNEVPWHRVVNSCGRISPRGLDGSDELQRYLLEAEGVIFGENGRIPLARYGWRVAEGE